MLKKLPVFLILSVFLILLFTISTYAQDTDPNTIKLKSFTPAPSKTPAILPTNPTGVVSPIPTNSNIDPSCTASNRGFVSDCSVIGMNLQQPKPRYLTDTSLCTEAMMYPYYKSSFVSPDLVNLHDAIGDRFWVKGDGSVEILYNKCKIDDLANLLQFVEENYNCISFVGYGYRSFSEQQSLWNSRGCATNPGCGVATPGRSLHQGGIAVDLFCMEWNGIEWVLNDIPDSFTNNTKDFNFHRPLPEDPPHFNGI